MSDWIETKGFAIWTNGDPSVGMNGTRWELTIPGGTTFEDIHELREFKDGLAQFFGGFHAGKYHVLTLEEEATREGALAIEAASSATGEHVSEGGDTAESATAVIRRDAQEQPTEGKHPSSVKGIGTPPRYFTQEEVKELVVAAKKMIEHMEYTPTGSFEPFVHATKQGPLIRDLKIAIAKHGITDL